MTKSHATAEVFWTAFKALPRKQRAEVLRLVASDEKMRRDLLDLSTFEARSSEPSRLLRSTRAARKRRA